MSTVSSAAVANTSSLALRSWWLGAHLGLRALHRRSSLVALAALLCLAALAALLEARLLGVGQSASSRFGAQRAADLALTGAAFGLLLPVAGYALATRLSGATSLGACVSSLARYGAHRRWALLGIASTNMLALLLVALLLALVTVVSARGFGDPGLAADWLVTSKVALLAGTVYAWYFALAATLGARGQGRFWALLFDWTLGSGVGAMALPWPRGHLRNLLGAEPVLHFSQPAAAGWLLGLSLFSAIFVFWRHRA